MSPRERTLRATVLHVRSFGEAHRIVEVVTPEEGRLAAVARNARLSKRRFAGALDAFVTAELELTPGAGLWTLKSAALVAARLGLRSDLDRLARASLCCEAVRLLVAEHASAPEAFAALGVALDALETGDLGAAAVFLVRLLGVSGIAPDLGVCVRCGHRPEAVSGVDGRLGGVVCSDCSRAPPLSPAALAVLAGGPPADLDAALAAERLAIDWIEAQTGRSLHSLASALGPPPR